MDTTFYRDVNSAARHSAWAHSFLVDVAVYGVGVFGLLVILAWWFARYRPEAPRAVAASVWAAAATLIAVAVNQPIASAVGRARPFTKVPGAEVLVARSHDFSFPSDHAVAAGAAAAGLWIVAHYGGRASRIIAGVATLLALLLAFARVYVGVHYPGDVAAGLVLGALVAVIGWLALDRVLTYCFRRLAEQRPLRPLVIALPPTGSQRSRAA